MPLVPVTATTGIRGRIVVGAGPGGSATAAYLAMQGLDVLLLEKTEFPREKVCGDGLTPRAVKELITLGVPTPQDEGWIKNRGLRIDHILASTPVVPRVAACTIDRVPRKWPKPSDHAPVTVEIDPTAG